MGIYRLLYQYKENINMLKIKWQIQHLPGVKPTNYQLLRLTLNSEDTNDACGKII